MGPMARSPLPAILIALLLLIRASAVHGATMCGVPDTDWAALRDQLAGMTAAGYGPLLVRLAWADAATYNATDGTGGSRGTLKLVPPSGSKVTLQTAIDALEVLKERYPAVGYGDLWAFAGSVSIRESGGPAVKFRCGRVDYLSVAEWNATMAAGRVPPGSYNAAQVRKAFTRMGLNDIETVAVVGGGHALGKCHYDRSGYIGPWTDNPYRFTNQFFSLLSLETWNRVTLPNTKYQFNTTDNSKMMLPSDYAMWEDPDFKTLVLKFAANNTYFLEQFSVAYQKLVERGATLSDANLIPTEGSTSSGIAPLSSPSDGSGSVQKSGSWMSVPLGDRLKLAWKVRESAGYVDFVVYSNCSGWFAFGIGPGMGSQDIYAYEPSTSRVTNYISTSFAKPSTNVDLGGSDCVENFADMTQAYGDSTYVKVVAFSRKLVTGDSRNSAIAAGLTIITYAWSSTDQSIAYHGPNKSKIQLDLFNACVSSHESNSTIYTLQASHGLFMLFAFGVLLPLGIFAARNSHELSKWLQHHQNVVTWVYTHIFIGAVIALVTKISGGEPSLHANLGAALFGLATVAIVSGLSLAHYFDFSSIGVFLSKRNLTGFMKWFHIVVGYLTYLIGLTNGFLGATDFMTNVLSVSQTAVFVAQILYVIAMASLPAFLLVYEQRRSFYKPIKGEDGSENGAEVKLDRYKLRSAVDPEITKLVEMSWDDVNARVAEGQKYIVIKDVVYNLESTNAWLRRHPGGAKILELVVGTDCTEYFLGSEVPGSHRKGHVHSRIAEFQLKSLACGRINFEKGSKSSVGGHSVPSMPVITQSAVLATTDMNNPAVPSGGLISRTRTGSVALRNASSLQRSPSHATSRVDVPLSTVMDQVFKLLPLKSKTPFHSNETATKIYKFTFAFPKPTDQIDLKPGEHVSMQLSDAQGNMIERSYTSITSVAKGSISFYIRIRPRGAFTPLLDKLKIGDGMRMKTMRNESTQNPMLLSPAPSQCFAKVGMVASGLGITPMLQLIDFYIRSGPRKVDGNPAFKLWLNAFFANAQEVVVGKDDLDNYKKLLGPALTVNTVVQSVANPLGHWESTPLDQAVRKANLAPNLPPPPKRKASPLLNAGAPAARSRSASISSQVSAREEAYAASQDTLVVISGNGLVNDRVVEELATLQFENCVVVLH